LLIKQNTERRVGPGVA